MNELPDLVSLEILKYLDYKDLIHIGEVCRRFNALISIDKLWEYQCRNVWLLSHKSDHASWKDAFIEQYMKFSKYLSCYKKIKSSWIALEEFLAEHCPEIHATLNPGIDESILVNFEKMCKVVLPLDYKLSYLIHNGQNCDFPEVFDSFVSDCLPKECCVCSGLLTFGTAVKCFDCVRCECDQCKYSLPLIRSQSLEFSVAQLVQPQEPEHDVTYKTGLITFRAGGYRSIASSFSEWFSCYVEMLVNGHHCMGVPSSNHPNINHGHTLLHQIPRLGTHIMDILSVTP